MNDFLFIELFKCKVGIFSGLCNNFLVGFVVVVLIGLIVWLIWIVVGWIDGFVWLLVLGGY